MASLWEISDPSTAALMGVFYQNLKSMDIGEALIRAQRDMIAGNVTGSKGRTQINYSHPYYWAPFVLVGDWN